MFIFDFSLPLGNYCKDEVECRNYREQLLFLFCLPFGTAS
jgi:hypothetical protein